MILESYLMTSAYTGNYENTHRFNSLVYPFCFVLATGTGVNSFVSTCVAYSAPIPDCRLHTGGYLQTH